MGGYGIGIGIGEGLHRVADDIRKSSDRKYADTMDQSQKIYDQMKAVALNTQSSVPKDEKGNLDTKHPTYIKNQIGRAHV